MEGIPNSNFIHQDNYQKIFLGALRDKAVPRYLYKYMSIDSAIRFLKTSKLLFAKPEMFNDPFDCRAYIDISTTSKEVWISFFGKYISDYSSVNSLVEKIIVDRDNLQITIQGWIDYILSSFGVLCMTTAFDNILMWSHYADSHKGVCIRFDITKDCDSFFFPVKVSYDAKYPSFNYVEEPSQLVPVLMHKSSDWSYENEYRIVRINGFGLNEIKKDSVDSIIFGCKTTEEDIKAIMQLATEYKYYSVNYIKAKVDNKSYNLNFFDIPNSRQL